ncbi:MAG: PEP-CTERM sorting domain-containing protein [Pseudomonadota bacterium]
MKNLMRRVLTTAAVSAGLIAGAAQAAIISVDDTLSGPQYVQTGRVISGTFDLRPYLADNSVIDWARVTFQFSDDYDPLRYSGGGGSYYSGYHRTYTNDMERVNVSTMGQSSTVGTTYDVDRSYSPRRVSYTSYRTVSYRRSYRCGWFRTCYRTYYRRVPYTTYRTVQDVQTNRIANGPFTASYLLDSDALNRLLDVGLADFQVTGVQGDSMFRNATLEASISSVPEPSALALIALGLGGLAYRRRRNAQAA